MRPPGLLLVARNLIRVVLLNTRELEPYERDAARKTAA